MSTGKKKTQITFLQADWKDKEKQRTVPDPKEAEKEVCAETRNRWNKPKTAGRFKPTISIITLNVSDLNQGWAKYSPLAKSSHACFEYQWCRFYTTLPGLTHCDGHSVGCNMKACMIRPSAEKFTYFTSKHPNNKAEIVSLKKIMDKLLAAYHKLNLVFF